MCLSGLPASFTWIVKESGAIRISSWVTGTLVRRQAGTAGSVDSMHRTMSDLRAMTDWLYPLLRCPVCQGELEFRALDASRAQGLLLHSRPGCDEVYPVIDDVPRMLVGTARAEVVR